MEAEEKIEFQRGETFGEMLYRIRARRLEKAVRAFPADTATSLLHCFRRIHHPWPPWVLRMYASVFHSSFPTVSIDHIDYGLKFIHWIFLEARRGSATTPPAAPDLSEAQQAELFGRLFGHLSAWTDYLVEQMSRFPELQREFSGDLKANRELTWRYWKLHPTLSNAVPGEMVATALVDARQRTFDSEGRFRETPATALYSAILKEWPEIELMSGPTELCRLLEPKMGAGDFQQKLGRMKKICTRFKVQFMDCQGTRVPPRVVPGRAPR